MLITGEEARKSWRRTNSLAEWPYLGSLGYHLLVEAVAVLLSSSSRSLRLGSDGYWFRLKVYLKFNWDKVSTGLYIKNGLLWSFDLKIIGTFFIWAGILSLEEVTFAVWGRGLVL